MINEPRYTVCSQDDIMLILEICKQSYLEHYTYLWTDEGDNYMRVSFTKEKILSEMEDVNSQFYLIYAEEKPVGVLKINYDKSVDGTSNRDYLEIERIYFLKQAAGKGLGKHALNMVHQLAKRGNKKTIWLKAMKGADAVQFYERQGFLVTGEVDLSFPYIKDELKRMVMMQLPVT